MSFSFDWLRYIKRGQSLNVQQLQYIVYHTPASMHFHIHMQHACNSIYRFSEIITPYTTRSPDLRYISKHRGPFQYT